MQIFQYEMPDLLIKVSNNKKHLEDLCNGKVYMNESGYFRKLEDTYRGDKFDGKRPISFGNHIGEFFEFGPEDEPDKRIKIPVEAVSNFTIGFVNDDKIPLYCCSQVSEKILRKESETSIRFRDEFVLEMEKFGMYYVLFNKNEFLANISKQCPEDSIYPMYGAVSYVDIQSEYLIEVLNEQNRNQYEPFFKKDLSYQWQNEWRIILLSNTPLIAGNENHLEVLMNPLSWYHIGEISELRTNTIEIRETDEDT